MSFPINTTAPGSGSTCDDLSDQVPAFAFIILWSKTEPHRVGEIVFFLPFEIAYVGRGDVEVEKFPAWMRHQPGEPLTAGPSAGFLGGATISRRQLRMTATAVALQMLVIGRCVTLVNGEKRESADLQPGDTVMLEGEVLLLCVRRPRTLPAMPPGTPVQRFGEPDALEIVGESLEAWRMRAKIYDAAASEADVLIRGESGVGKELVAKSVYKKSNRSSKPYWPHNAVDIVPTLVSSELFGNIAGYPNSGMPARKGIIGDANGGTLFFDEIGDMPPEAQAVLLRTLQEGVYRTVGESKVCPVDIRIIGATDQGDDRLRPQLRGRFKKVIRVPPLRERQEDIPLLVRHILGQSATESTDPEVNAAFVDRFFTKGPSGELYPRISGRFIEALVRHPLPLNVRDLEIFLAESVAESKSQGGNKFRLPSSLDPDKSRRSRTSTPSAANNTTEPIAAPRSASNDTTEPIPPPSSARNDTTAPIPPALDTRKGKADPSREVLLACLVAERWNVSRVGDRVGIHRNTVYRLMKEYGITRDETEK